MKPKKDFDNILCKYACDRVYHVTSDSYTCKGILLNYYGGNIILLTKKGIVHLKYRDIGSMYPANKVSNDLQKIIDDLYEKDENEDFIVDKDRAEEFDRKARKLMEAFSDK